MGVMPRCVGVPAMCNFGFVIAVALVVAVAARTVGSCMSLSVVISCLRITEISRSWKQCCFYCRYVDPSLGGLVISYELGLKPGGTNRSSAVVTTVYPFW